jgi:hypothetical protein
MGAVVLLELVPLTLQATSVPGIGSVHWLPPVAAS